HPSRISYTVGMTNKVSSVDVITPPITARPNGARKSAPSPCPIATGSMPAIGHGEGADFRAPLGRAVICGVITSTLLTLLVIPTVYEILEGWKERAVERFFKRRGTGEFAVPEAEPAHGDD